MKSIYGCENLQKSYFRQAVRHHKLTRAERQAIDRACAVAEEDTGMCRSMRVHFATWHKLD